MKRNEISLPMNKEKINKLLKQLTVHFHWKINKIYEASEQLRCLVKKCITLCDTATKMIKGTYRGPLPEYFRETFDEIEDENWKMFFVQRIVVYHDHFSSCGSGEMNLNGVRCFGQRIKMSKTWFQTIPVEEGMSAHGTAKVKSRSKRMKASFKSK